MPFIMVLNDGETFTNLEGCQIVAVEDTEEIEEKLKTMNHEYDLRKAWVVREFKEVPDDADYFG